MSTVLLIADFSKKAKKSFYINQIEQIKSCKILLNPFKLQYTVLYLVGTKLQHIPILKRDIE